MLHRQEARASEQSWRATLIAVCIAQATAIVGFDFTVPFIPLYLEHDLGVHGLAQVALWSGLIGFGPAIPATIFGPVWGKIADRMGYRLMLLRAMVSAAVLLALMGLAPSPAILLVLRMIQGALTGTVFSSQALIAASVPEKELGRSMGMLQMSISLGATLGPVGGGVVAQLFGYRTAFIGAGALIASAAAIAYFFVHEPAKRENRTAETGPAPSILSVLRVPAFALALFLMLSAQICATALFPIIPLYVQDLLHSTQNVASDTGWVMALAGIASAGGSYVAGRLQRNIELRPLLIGALVLSALLLIPQGIAGNYVEFLAIRALDSACFGALFSFVGIRAALSSPPDAKGTAFGLMGAASSLGFGGGPLAGGALAAAFGLRPIFLLAGVSLAAVPVLLVAAPSLASALRLGRAALTPARE